MIQEKLKKEWCDKVFNEVVKANTEAKNKWLRTKSDANKVLYKAKRMECKTAIKRTKERWRRKGEE